MDLEDIIEEDRKIVELSKEFRSEAREMFSLYDRVGIGTISVSNAKTILSAFSRFPSKEQWEGLVEKYSQDAQVSYANLLEIFKAVEEIYEPEDDVAISEAFSVYDYQATGHIFSKDLFHIITRIGGQNKLTKEEASQMLNEFDIDVKGRVKKADICEVVSGMLT